MVLVGVQPVYQIPKTQVYLYGQLPYHILAYAAHQQSYMKDLKTAETLEILLYTIFQSNYFFDSGDFSVDRGRFFFTLSLSMDSGVPTSFNLLSTSGPTVDVISKI